jgi:hypothetical protein
LLERPQIVRHVWIFCCERFDVTDFYVNSFYAWPFGARAEEPAAISDDARSVEGVARDQKLHTLTPRADPGRLWRARLFHFRAALELRSDHLDNGDKADRCGSDAGVQAHPVLP